MSTRGQGLPGDWRGSVVYFAGTSWDGNRGTDQHLAERLARWAPVVYVDPPVSVVSRGGGWQGRSVARGPRLVNERLVQVTPIVGPGKSRFAMRRWTGRVVRAYAKHAVSALDATVEVVVAATLYPVFGALDERHRVLFATDDFAAGAELMGISRRWVLKRERIATKEADRVVAVSDHLAMVIRNRAAVDPIVVENGVDNERFAATDDAPLPCDVSLRPPVAGLIGQLSDRIDLDILEATASTGCSVLLVGPTSPELDLARFRRLLNRPNVAWVGPKPYDLLPSYMRTVDVGLLPYAATAFNRSSFPLKVLEYLAAGRPAVVTDLPSVRHLGDSVRISEQADEFAATVTDLLAAPRDPTAMAARRAVAAQYSWDIVAERFAEAIDLG